jgi:hypothetical protein
MSSQTESVTAECITGPILQKLPDEGGITYSIHHETTLVEFSPDAKFSTGDISQWKCISQKKKKKKKNSPAKTAHRAKKRLY